MNKIENTNYPIEAQQKETLQEPQSSGANNMADFDKEVANLYPLLLHLAKRYCSFLEDAEDLVGDTICKVLSNRDKFQNDKSLRSWCNTILINTYFTSFRKNSLINFVSYDSAYDASSILNPFNSLCYEEIVSAIQGCSEHSISIECLLLHIQGFSYEEISLSSHIPIGTVKSRISFARKILAQRLNITYK